MKRKKREKLFSVHKNAGPGHGIKNQLHEM